MSRAAIGVLLDAHIFSTRGGSPTADLPNMFGSGFYAHYDLSGTAKRIERCTEVISFFRARFLYTGKGR